MHNQLKELIFNEKKAMVDNACDALSQIANEIEELLSVVPDPSADESNFALGMRKQGCTPEDFVAPKNNMDNTSASYAMPCSFRKTCRARIDKFKEVTAYANDVVVTAVMICYVRNAMCRKPCGQDQWKNPGVVLASIKARDETAVPAKFQEEAQFILDAFGDSKPPKDSKPSEADTEPSSPTGSGSEATQQSR